MRGDRTKAALIGIPAILVGLLALNAVAGLLLSGGRLDLTEEGLYSTSPGVVEMVRGLEEPVRLDLYWTQGTGRNAPQVKAYSQRVREFLEELARRSEGMLTLRVLDPEPFSETEDTARAAGIAPLSIDGVGGTVMLGLVARGATDAEEVIPYLAPDQEGFLEYEVARAILTVGRGKKPKVGLISSLPTDAQMVPPGRMQQAPAVFTQMRALFDVQSVALDATGLPEGIDALVIVHPRGLSEGLLKAIDGWALGGGPVLLFFDPWCETDPAAAQMGMERGGTTSDLGPIPAAWGFSVDTQMVVGDRTYATRVRAPGPGGAPIELDYPVWLSLTKAAIDGESPVTGGIGALNLMSAGEIKRAGEGLVPEPLVRSSTDSMLIQTLKIGYFGNPDQLVRDFKPDGTQKDLVVRLHGVVRSAYPPAEGAAPPEGTAAGKPTTIVVVADADMLSDQTWIRQEMLGNISLGARTIADNGSLVINAVDMLAGSSALHGLRARGESRRPFDAIEAMRKEAEGQYLKRAQELQDQIRKAEMEINQMQREPTASGSLILTPEQEARLGELNQTVLAARKELRQVQHGLREAIDRTGRTLVVLDVVVWPLAVAALALLVALWRGRAA